MQDSVVARQQQENDQPEHAGQLAELLQSLRCKINLIPFNPFPGSGYERPLDVDIEHFQTIFLSLHGTLIAV